MRKIISLMLVLGMLLVSVTARAEEVQLLADSYFTYEIPMSWELV